MEAWAWILRGETFLYTLVGMYTLPNALDVLI